MSDEAARRALDDGKQICVVVSRLTVRAMLWAMQESMREDALVPQGKQSEKSLIGQGDSVKNIEVNDPKFKEFERILKKYGIDYAVTKKEGKYLVFFKAKDDDVLKQVLAECTKSQVNARKPSIHRQLQKIMQRLAAMTKRRKVREKIPDREL